MPTRYCGNCGQGITELRADRKALWCSESCRVTAYKANRYAQAEDAQLLLRDPPMPPSQRYLVAALESPNPYGNDWLDKVSYIERNRPVVVETFGMAVLRASAAPLPAGSCRWHSVLNAGESPVRDRATKLLLGDPCATCVKVMDLRKAQAAAARSALVAHAWHDEARHPADWFTDPKLSRESLTITAQGRVYGLIPDPTRGRDDLSRFLTGEVTCQDGTRVAVGQIAASYENTADVVADVTAGLCSRGIWLAGAVREDADPVRVEALRTGGRIEPDRRNLDGMQRLVGLQTTSMLSHAVLLASAQRRPSVPAISGRGRCACGRADSHASTVACRSARRST